MCSGAVVKTRAQQDQEGVHCSSVPTATSFDLGEQPKPKAVHMYHTLTVQFGAGGTDTIKP